mgnify:CR=1 FL=1
MGLKQNLHNFKEKNKDKKWLPGFNALSPSYICQMKPHTMVLI